MNAFPTLFGAIVAKIQGMTNITWNEGQNAFTVLLDRQLKASCATQRCHGGGISQPSFHRSSDASRMRRMITNPVADPVEMPSRARNGTIIPDEIFFSDSKTSFVTSSASRVQPPRVLTILPEMLGFLYHGVRHVLTPVSRDVDHLPLVVPSEPLFSMEGSSTDYLEVNEIPGVQTEYSDVSEKLSPKTKRGPTRPPEAPIFRLDEVMTGAVAWYLVGKASYEWWQGLGGSKLSIDYAPQQGRGKWERHTGHLFKKAQKALEALETFSRDDREVRAYKDVFDYRKEEFEDLKTLTAQTHPSQANKTLAPLKDREELEMDMHFLLKELESELKFNKVKLQHGSWVKR